MLGFRMSVGSARLPPSPLLSYHSVGLGACSKGARHSAIVCSQSEGTSELSGRKIPDVKSTIAGIDALLGIEEEKVESILKGLAVKLSVLGRIPSFLPNGRSVEKSNVEVSVSAAALNSLSNADGMSAATLDSLIRIIGTAKELERSNRASNPVDGAFREEVERVSRSLAVNSSVSASDVTIMKEEILGPKSFWVTEAAILENEFAGGVLLRGNLRAASAQEAFNLLVEGCAKRFGTQYTVNMVVDTQAEDSPPDSQPRVAFQVLPTQLATPSTATGWSTFAAIVLLLLTLGSTAALICGVLQMSLGVLAALPKLPAETLAWLSQADSPDFNGSFVPGITAAYDPVPFVSVVTTMFLSITGVNFAHEAGHRIAAFFRKVKLGPALFVPNGSLGSFGSVTMSQSLMKDRSSMWDVAAAGPIAGLSTGIALFVFGLMASTDATTDPAMLIPVPNFLFQGSIALGSVAEAVLGNGIDGKVLVHPAVIAGWCTLFTQAFNLLPVGALDGGRLTQSAYGRSALDWAGVLSYMGLALGVIGSSLSLPFGLFVLLAQREPERYIQDQVTGVGRTRETITTILILLAVLILIPFTPDSPDMMDMLPSAISTTSSSLTA